MSEGSDVDEDTEWALFQYGDVVSDEHGYLADDVVDEYPRLTVTYDSNRSDNLLTKEGKVWRVAQVTESGSYYHIHFAQGEGEDQRNWYVHWHRDGRSKLTSVNGDGPETDLGPVLGLEWSFPSRGDDT